MASSRTAKPLVSAALALALVVAFVLPGLSITYLAGPSTPFDIVQAGSIHYAVIIGIALLWLGVQLFWRSTADATKLGMVASASIFWLSIALLFGFTNASVDEGVRGAMAFFTLMGGLGITLAWTRFLADEISL